MLPAILSLAGPAIAAKLGATALPAFAASAIGAGVGSLLQGGDTDDVLKSAALGGLGSYIGGQFGTSSAMGGDPSALAAAGNPDVAGKMFAGANLPAGVTPESLGTTAGRLASQTTTAPTFLESLTKPAAIGAGLAGSLAPPPKFDDFKSDDVDVPRGKALPGTSLTTPVGYRPGIDPEFNYGIVPNFQEGGIVDLARDEAPMGEMNDKELISKSVDAIKGMTDNPEMILGMFLAKFGEDALRDLVEKVRSGQFDDNAGDAEGMVRGMGDGMDDMIPASMKEGDQDVLLSDGEFVVPADVVSGLGNGSSDAGADKLDNMMDRVRELRTGGRKQPPDIPDEMMLPA